MVRYKKPLTPDQKPHLLNAEALMDHLRHAVDADSHSALPMFERYVDAKNSHQDRVADPVSRKGKTRQVVEAAQTEARHQSAGRRRVISADVSESAMLLATSYIHYRLHGHDEPQWREDLDQAEREFKATVGSQQGEQMAQNVVDDIDREIRRGLSGRDREVF